MKIDDKMGAVLHPVTTDLTLIYEWMNERQYTITARF